MTVWTFESRSPRILVGRVARGRGLQEALAEIADANQLTTAWISALGAFEWIEVTEYCQKKKEYEAASRLERCELLALQGNLSIRDDAPFWHVHATLSKRDDGQDKAYGGHVLDGVVFALEFRIEALDDLNLTRTLDEATGLQLWGDQDGASAAVDSAQRRDVTSSEEASGTGGVTWAMAAQASAKTTDVPVDYQPRHGDWLDHRKFGLCKIERLSGDGVCIIRLPDSRRKKIQLRALQILEPRQDGDRLIYPVQPKAKH